MTRRGVGAGIATLGALTVTASAYPTWYVGEGPRDWPLQQLFQAGSAGSATAFWGSVAAPLVIVGMLGVLGAVLRFRFILGLGWLLGTATVTLWAVMRAIDGDWRREDLETGAWLCIAGLVVLIGGILVMGPRRDAVEAPLRMFDNDPPQ